MIYSNDQIVRSKYDSDIDSLYKLSLESYLFSLKNYHESVENMVREKIDSIGNTSLNESVNIKEKLIHIGTVIKNIFKKIFEIIQSFTTTITSAFYASDQLVNKNFATFKEKVDNYGKTIKYKILVLSDMNKVLGKNGSEYSDKVIDKISGIIDDIPTKGLQIDDIEEDLSKLRGDLLGKGPLTEKAFKEEITGNLFIERSGVGLPADLVDDIVTVMSLSPDLIKNSWDRSAQKQMKKLLDKVKTLEKNNKDNSEMTSAINKCRVYINGGLHIVNSIYNIYIKANMKAISQYRKLFLKILRTNFNSKSNEIVMTDSEQKEDE